MLLLLLLFLRLGLIKQQVQNFDTCGFILKIVTIFDSLCLCTLICTLMKEIYFDMDYSSKIQVHISANSKKLYLHF